VFKDKKVRKLVKAIQNGDIKEIRKSVNEGVLINYVGEGGITPLAWAALSNNKESFKELIKLGADVNNKASPKYSLLYIIVNYELPSEFAELALQYGADPNCDTPGGPLITITYHPKTINILKMLLKAGVDIDTKRAGGYTLLHESAFVGYYETTWFLLNNGADYTKTGDNGTTLLDIIEMNNQAPDLDNQTVYREKILSWLKNKKL